MADPKENKHQKTSHVPRPPAVLFYHKSMSQLAESICERCSRALDQSSSTKQKELLYYQQSVELRSVSWEQFPDGWPNLFIANAKQDCAGRDVIFLASFHSPEVVFEQLSVIYKIPRLLARSFTAIVPYFPTGTMEREETEGQVATAKTLAILLSTVPLTARGPSQIMVFDIHAPLFCQALLSAGAVKISAYVTHAVFPKDSWKLFTDCEVPFSKFYITDSIPHATSIAQHSPFKLLSLCDSISETLLGFDLLQS